MAWTTPATFTSGQILTAAQMNTNVRDNTNALYSRDGLIYITSQTITSTNTVTLDNIFSTTYKAWRINLQLTGALSWVSAVLRNSTPADITTSNYDQTVIQTTTTVDKTRVTATGQTSWANLFLTGDRGSYGTFELFNPAQTDYTQGVVSGFSSENADVSKSNSVMGGFGFRATTAAAGIKFNFGVSTSGLVRVYAYGEG